MMFYRWRLTILMLCTSFILSGCIGAREINDIALVMAVGIDKGSESGKVKVTVSIARPTEARAQSGSPSGGTGGPTWTISAEGDSIFESIRNLARFTTRRIFWAHNFMIVINEELAREGITDIIDFFSRNHELRMRTWVVVTSMNTSELLATKTGLELLPGESIDKLFRYSKIVAEAPRTDLKTLSAAYQSKTTQPILARLRVKEREIEIGKNNEFGSKEQIELSGAAVFKKDKMIGWLSPVETRSLLFFTEKVDSGVLVLSCPQNSDLPVSLELKKNNFKVKPFYKNREILFDISLDVEADMVELGCPSPLDNKTIMKNLEQQLENKLHKEIENVVIKAQNTYKSDFLELGKVFQNRYPTEFNKIYTEWEKHFSKAKINIKVTSHIHSPVLLAHPTRTGKE